MHAALRRALPVIVFAAAIIPAAAQAPAPGSEWTGWRGCWRLIAEAGTITPGGDQPMVCVTEIAGGARLTTTVGNKAVLDQIIRTDGREQALEEGDCKGTQRAEWSRTGARLYSRATVTCAGDPEPRRVSGYALLLQDGSWLDIQAAETGSRDSVRVRRYRHVDTATSPAPIAGRSLRLDDIKEASVRVSPAALEAAVVESHAILPLSSKALLDLDAVGVPDRVIDLMVALAYPEKFIVERPARAESTLNSILYLDNPFLNYGMYGLPIWSALGAYDPYWRPYHYSPFAYSYYDPYDPRFYDYRYGQVVAGGGGSVGGGGTDRPRPAGNGKVVNGQGYTRVRDREVSAEQEPRTRTSDTTASTSSTSTSSTAASAPAASSSSGSTASPSGFSSGGGDTGRTAVPR